MIVFNKKFTGKKEGAMHSIREANDKRGSENFAPNIEVLNLRENPSLSPTMALEEADYGYNKGNNREWENIIVNPRVARKGSLI